MSDIPPLISPAGPLPRRTALGGYGRILTAMSVVVLGALLVFKPG